MKTIITLDKANQPYGFPQLNGNGNFNNIIVESGITATTLTITGLTENLSDTNLLSVDGNGVVHTYPISGLTGSSSTSGAYLPLSGGTVTGLTIFQSGTTINSLTATTISNTYLDNFYIRDNTSTVAIDTSNRQLKGSNGSDIKFNWESMQFPSLTSNGYLKVSGGTGNIYVDSSSPSSSGAYLPLSGGTVTGGTVFQSGVTANTISQTQYIDFTTGTTNPSSVAGRVFFDTTQKALSYFDISNNQVPIAMGQSLYTRVWNATGVQIDKGKVIAITGTSNNLPSAILAVNTHGITSARPIGLAAENIPNGSEGLVLNNGILSGITLNGFANGDTLYLSDTTPGSYVASTSSLAFTARTNEIGYVLQTGSSTGKIYVTINNEDSNLSLTDKERNILEGNVISGGIYEYTGMTQGTGQTINVAYARGWIVKNTYAFATQPDVTNIYYTGGTNIPLTYLTSADATYILINSGATLVQQTTFPTPQQRRENIFLGKVVHPNRSTITSINNTVDFDVSPMAALRDLWTPIKLINQGVVVSYYSANTMSIQTSAGYLWGNGIGWYTNQLNPDSVSISGTSPTTFQYRSRYGSITGSTGLPAAPTGNTTVIDSHHYDLNGSIVAVGANNRATNQRVYLFPTGLIRIQYGQYSYSTMANAIAGIDTEVFVEFSNNRDNGILIGILTVREDATNLADTGDAQFRFVSKFGELLGGAGGISTTTLQQAYENSSYPAEIVTNSTLGGLRIKNGQGADNVSTIFEAINSGGTSTAFMRADGLISGSSVSAPTISGTTYYGLPSQSGTGVSAFSYNQSTGLLTITKNDTNTLTAGTFSYVTATTLSAANVLSVTKNGGSPTTTTINAVTGGTYSSGTITLSGTGSVNGNTITGLNALTPTTFYSGDGSLSGNRVINLSSYTLNFSSSTNPNTLVMSGGNVGIGVLSPTFKLDVSGVTRLQGTTSTDGGVLGSELLTTGSATNWVGTSFALGYTHTAGSTAVLTSTFTPTIGNFYQVTYTSSGASSGIIGINLGNVTVVGGLLNGSGVIGLKAVNASALQITPSTDYNGTVIASVKQISAGTATILMNNGSGVLANEIRAFSSSTNTAMGFSSGQFIITGGINNTMIGFSAGTSITNGYSNSFLGYLVGNSTTTGIRNTAIGDSALSSNVGGSQNTAIGMNALSSSVGLNNNTSVGFFSLSNLTAGNGNNTVLGYQAGRYISGLSTPLTNIASSVLIGHNTVPLADGQTNQIVIGASAVGLGSNTTVIGTSSTTGATIWGNLTLGTTTNSTNNKLVVSAATDPVKFVGLQTVTTDTSVLTVDGTGVVHTAPLFNWNNATTATTATTSNGYVGTATTLTTITLPTGATFGSVIEVVGTGTGLWRISQNANQFIKFGVTGTTTGTGGYLSATSQYDCVKLLCTSANTAFVVTSAIGNIFYI